MSRIVFVLNGPNLNLLGQRQPIFMAMRPRGCRARLPCLAKKLKLEIRFHQSNREYELSTGSTRPARGFRMVINPAASRILPWRSSTR